jgi:hypothetical protein
VALSNDKKGQEGEKKSCQKVLTREDKVTKICISSQGYGLLIFKPFVLAVK